MLKHRTNGECRIFLTLVRVCALLGESHAFGAIGGHQAVVSIFTTVGLFKSC